MLRVIASSPTELQAVMDALVESVHRLCGADGVTLREVDGEVTRLVAASGLPTRIRVLGDEQPLSRDSQLGRAILDGEILNVADRQSPGSLAEFPLRHQTIPRSTLAVPLRSHGVVIGVLVIGRIHVEPFNEREVALAETFADQAVIAIENARLFEELERRNAELGEALEQQPRPAR
ncbi:MAG TPA: GAF domain-containing protein [Kribbellaceae bacterium]|nr:GAF domain-containing protein [Kribbellaceae bacterium]